MIRGVSKQGFRINGEWLAGPVALTGEQVLEQARAPAFADLAIGDLDELLGERPEVLLLGTGDASQFAPRELTFAMARRGIGFEVMDSRAAARTFNVLVAEDRRVAALLFPVDADSG